jgi:cytochrome c-type biogenesis protein CcmE
MSSETQKYLKFSSAIGVILVALGFLAYTGVQESKSYYVTIKELRGMGDSAHTKRLRVAGNVQPGSIKRTGTKVRFCPWCTAERKRRPTLSKITLRR